MTDRQTTPDVLGVLMSEASPRNESKKAIKTDVQLAIKPESNKARKQPSNKLVAAIGEETKEKATFNISKALLNELEDAWTELRRELDSKQVSKTLLVETALRLAFDDLKARKQESGFYRSIASNKMVRE